MRLASFQKDGRSRWGIVDGTVVADVGTVLRGHFADLREMLGAEAYSDATKAVAFSDRYSLDDITWLPVIPNPAKILCVGLNYESHRLETGRAKSTYPTIFTRFADSQIGHNVPIERPAASTALDFEGEMAVIIGKGGRYIKQADALAHIASYACYNDSTLRDWQHHTHQFIFGKNFPSTGGFGPWMVTPDEMGALDTHRLTTRVNGTVVQEAAFSQLNFSIPVLIEYCSAFTPLSPGDVIVTGTPSGVGFKRTPPLFLKPGDSVDVEITGIGILSIRSSMRGEKRMGGMFEGEPGLVVVGRLLIALGFLVAAFRNTSTRYQIDGHINRLGSSGMPLPDFAFWAGNWHAAIGAYCLLFFTIVSAGSLLRFWEVPDRARRSGMQNGFMSNIAICRETIALAKRREVIG